ncbi:MAG: glycosyltransferase family protein [Bacteroidia bacterium]
MKVLYAIQGTGNGHVSRARELIPHLLPHTELDILISGTHAEINPGHPVRYQRHGMGFIFGKAGGVDIKASIRAARPWQFLRDIRQLKVKAYDLILNDFEPISAYAAKIAGIKIRAISHQAAFLSPLSPRPKQHKSAFAEWMFRHYAPCHSAIGFHFKAYDNFIHTPIIREEVRKLAPSLADHICVYLPAYGDEQLIRHFTKRKEVRWQLFSKHTKNAYEQANVQVIPVSNERYLASMAAAQGILTGGGFETPAEALFLGKKLMVIPMENQFEQHCNAAALGQMGVPVCEQINGGFSEVLKSWLYGGQALHYPFADNAKAVIAKALEPIG